MDSSDPTKLEDGDSESENEEWILVTDEEDLSSSFVDVEDTEEDSNASKEMQMEAQIPQSDPTTDNKSLDIVQAIIEPKQESQAESVNQTESSTKSSSESSTESTKIKTSYAEVVRKANKAKTTLISRNGKTRAKRKKKAAQGLK